MQLDVPDRDTLSTSIRRGEQELVSTLGDQGERHSLLYFYSSKCLLCRSVAPAVERERDSCKDWLNVASVCTDDQSKWAPEMINYQVEAVPCFVLLNKEGNAVAKSGRPRNKSHVASTLKTLLRLANPLQQQQ